MFPKFGQSTVVALSASMSARDLHSLSDVGIERSDVSMVMTSNRKSSSSICRNHRTRIVHHQQPRNGMTPNERQFGTVDQIVAHLMDDNRALIAISSGTTFTQVVIAWIFKC
ncbi:hypothetical protein BDN72DRAFT_200243 [Pluteus cervinus]|uniref:Uncharacterized protein n=1 Tax=Pluteus cervinus TaxID=181527 RepID=A0ACD3B6I9_9AGAR|nr:hypothetical protein BDN72DRAFT_200243 [Pluteus cervinus]